MVDKFIEPITNEEFYVWVAPDGSMQLSLLATEHTTCLAITKLFHENGIGQSAHEMREKGFTIEKVNVTIQKL